MEVVTLSVLPPQIGLDAAGEALRKELNQAIVSIRAAYQIPSAGVDNLSPEELAEAAQPTTWVASPYLRGGDGYRLQIDQAFRDIIPRAGSSKSTSLDFAWRAEVQLRGDLRDRWFPVRAAALKVEQFQKYQAWLAAKAAAEADPLDPELAAALAAAKAAEDNVLARINDNSHNRLNANAIDRLIRKIRAFDDLLRRQHYGVMTEGLYACFYAEAERIARVQ